MAISFRAAQHSQPFTTCGPSLNRRRRSQPWQRQAVLAGQLAPAGDGSGISASGPAQQPWPHTSLCAARPSARELNALVRRPFVHAHRRRTLKVTTAAAAAAVAVAPAANPVVSLAAVLVGWLVIAGSCVRSLPQILRILKNKSVRGLSLTSFTSELVCYAITVSYNLTNGYAFSTFGDTAICALQNVAIVALIFRLGSVPRTTQLLLSGGLLALGAWLFTGACPSSLLTALQTGSVLLLALGGRLPQILLNVRRGNSGELSMLSCGLSLAGNLARVFTTLVLVRDPIILASASTQAILNGILTWQTVDTARKLRAQGGGIAATEPQPT